MIARIAYIIKCGMKLLIAEYTDCIGVVNGLVYRSGLTNLGSGKEAALPVRATSLVHRVLQ